MKSGERSPRTRWLALLLLVLIAATAIAWLDLRTSSEHAPTRLQVHRVDGATGNATVVVLNASEVRERVPHLYHALRNANVSGHASIRGAEGAASALDYVRSAAPPGAGYPYLVELEGGTFRLELIA